MYSLRAVVNSQPSEDNHTYMERQNRYSQKPQREGTKLANVAASICEYQLSRGRHFIVENPHSNKLWKLPAWQHILSQPGVVRATCDQCMKGLRSKTGQPARKRTSFVASSEYLVRRLRVKCDESHKHCILESGHTKPAQVWPAQLCRDIVDGILELKLRARHAGRKASVTQSYVFDDGGDGHPSL